jgi:hypothetical protein
MVIEKTELAAGLVLTGRYKGLEHKVLVLGDAEPFSFELDGTTVYKSLSSAAKAAMGGGSASVNGWRFFSIAGSEPAGEAPERKSKAKAASSRTVTQIKKRRKQEGCSEAEVAWFCSACMEGFCLPTGETPEVCPKGHPREVVDDFAGTPATSD